MLMVGGKVSFKKAKRAALWEGIIFPGIELSDSRFEYLEAKPRPSLEKIIQVAWLLTWNIPAGEEIPCIVVPNPCIKLGTREGENAFLVHGPRTQGSVRKLSGKGMALGLDLVPGGFFPFSGMSSVQIANASANIEELLPGFPLPQKSPWSIKAADNWFHEAEEFLESLPLEENHLPQISQFFRKLWDGDKQSSLDEIADEFETSTRSVQRIFTREIGMSPRDAIRTTRLHKALRTMSRDDIGTLASIALESGFFDQPHMIREFKALIKRSPAHLKKFL